jgi:hypothetical protein
MAASLAATCVSNLSSRSENPAMAQLAHEGDEGSEVAYRIKRFGK